MSKDAPSVVPTAATAEMEMVTISSVAELLAEFGRKFPEKIPHTHIRYWFRGHARTGWDLAPGVYRSSFNVPDENVRLVKECQMMTDFRIMSAGIRTGRETDVELYFLMQHYGIPTRLLDWTNNSLAALFFAVKDPGYDQHDAEIFMMDVYGSRGVPLARDLYGNPCGGIATSKSNALVEVIESIRDDLGSRRMPGSILAVRPDHGDRRMSLQRSCFTFHPSFAHKMTKKENHTLGSFLIPAARNRTCAENWQCWASTHLPSSETWITWPKR